MGKRTAQKDTIIDITSDSQVNRQREPVHVERVTEKKAKDPKKVVRAFRRCRPQKRLLEQLQAVKESLRPPVAAADNDGTSASPKEAKPPKRTGERPNHNHNWIPRIIGACLTGVHLRISLRAKTCACAPVPLRWRQDPRRKSRIILPS